MKKRYAHVFSFSQLLHGKGVTEVFLYPAVDFIDFTGLAYIYHALKKLAAAGPAEDVKNSLSKEVLCHEGKPDGIVKEEDEAPDRGDDFLVRSLGVIL